MLAIEDRMTRKRKNAYDRGGADYDRKAAILPAHVMVAPAVVDDPIERGKRLEVTVTLRDDILRHLRVREEIDEAQFQAGRLYERYVEQSQIGSVKAMDPTKEPVDGGGAFPEAITDRQIAAVRQLSEAGRVLGRRGEAMVRMILIDRLSFKEIAPNAGRYDLAYVRRHFFDCLEELAVFWSLAGRK